ncbi:hypothetical protein E4T43_07264 [Aureobasidium subglaciale]|nr:hypothetical protein E4T43_07264 [Aureobasidium subglaciale]
MIFAHKDLAVHDTAALLLSSKRLHIIATRVFADYYPQRPLKMVTKKSPEAVMDISAPPSDPLILSLPNEVLAMVFADKILSATDLAAVRVSCKELHAIATKEFAERHFQDPFVMVTEESLEALVEICRHPVFGPQVKKVQLLSAHVNKYLLSDRAMALVDGVDARDGKKMETAKAEMQWLMDATVGEYDFTTSELLHELLTDIFDALKAFDKPIAIASQRFTTFHPPIGLRKMFKGKNLQSHLMTSTPNLISTLGFMMAAASVSECKVGQVIIGVGALGYYPQYSMTPQSIASSRQKHQAILTQAEEFAVEFECRIINGRVNYEELEALSVVVQYSPEDLKPFSPSSDCDPFAFYVLKLPKEVLSPAFNALQNLSLTKVSLSETALVRCLMTNRKFLKWLKLTGVVIFGVWDRVLSYIVNHMFLEQCLMSEGNQIDNSQRRRGSRAKLWHATVVELHGQGEVRAGLSEYVETQAVAREAERVRRQQEKEKRQRQEAEREAVEEGKRTRQRTKTKEEKKKERAEEREEIRKAPRRSSRLAKSQAEQGSS